MIPNTTNGSSPLENVLDSFDAGMHPEAQHTGYYNDLDMMVMGMRGMTNSLDRVHMGLWAISSAPLMVGSDLTRLSPATLSLLTNREALAIHNDPYGLQPIKVDEPTPGVQIWVKPMAIAGRRAIAILNRTDASAQVKINWEKLGLKGTPRSLRDVWNGQNVETANGTISVPAHDLALMIVDGEDIAPKEYAASQDSYYGDSGDTWVHLRTPSVHKHLRPSRRSAGQKHIRLVHLPRSATDCRVGNWHHRAHSAPRNSRPLVPAATRGGPQAGYLCLVICESERARTPIEDGRSVEATH